MKKQSNQFKLVLGLIIALILLIFVVLNVEPVAINFGFFQPKMPLIIILVLMMLLGAIVSWLLGNSENKYKVNKSLKKQESSFKKQYERTIAEKEQKISELEAEVDRLKQEKNSESSGD
ncbi:LapA family protein [Lactobacillus sp. PV034]|uniref:LapA family protein n=1 Tax=Lactobacillus sp. PV034 TaxID=2594495 RepID=UPI0022401A8D|nr:LapA family protein [Lactobacillus sp. PV034]QNQ80497.1 LapA family protein [Lactobacillus sp. PV034]